jgi:phytoene/squalene synthetase
MSLDREREHLAEADRHISEFKTHIAWQREIIQELVEKGHDAELAVSMHRIPKMKMTKGQRIATGTPRARGSSANAVSPR